MIIIFVPAVPAAAAVAQVVFECDVCGRFDGLHGDVVLGPVAVLVVDTLGLAGVDVSVVPEREGGEGGHGVVGVVLVADGGEAFVVVFAGAVVEGEDLEERGWEVSGCFLMLGRGRDRLHWLRPIRLRRSGRTFAFGMAG